MNQILSSLKHSSPKQVLISQGRSSFYFSRALKIVLLISAFFLAHEPMAVAKRNREVKRISESESVNWSDPNLTEANRGSGIFEDDSIKEPSAEKTGVKTLASMAEPSNSTPNSLVTKTDQMLNQVVLIDVPAKKRTMPTALFSQDGGSDFDHPETQRNGVR